MAQNITKSMKALLEEANAVVKMMPVDDAKRVYDDDSTVFVVFRDIRAQ